MKDLLISKKIVEDLKSGDIIAFDIIYKKHFNRLLGFTRRYLKNDKDSEDIVQAVFLKIWATRSKIDIYTSFESFIFTITYNSIISFLRKKMSENKYLEQLKSTQQSDVVFDLNEDINYNELNKKVDSLLGQLTPRQKEVFVLSRVEGLTHKKIAIKLNISTNTVKNHMVSALAFLKDNIDRNYLAFFLFIYIFQ